MSREIHEFYVRPMNATAETLENHLNAMGGAGWELYPIPFPVKDKPVLVMHRSHYVTDDPKEVEKRVGALVEYVKAELELPQENDPYLRKIVELVTRELL